MVPTVLLDEWRFVDAGQIRCSVGIPIIYLVPGSYASYLSGCFIDNHINERLDIRHCMLPVFFRPRRIKQGIPNLIKQYECDLCVAGVTLRLSWSWNRSFLCHLHTLTR